MSLVPTNPKSYLLLICKYLDPLTVSICRYLLTYFKKVLCDNYISTYLSRALRRVSFALDPEANIYYALSTYRNFLNTISEMVDVLDKVSFGLWVSTRYMRASCRYLGRYAILQK